MVEIEFVGSTMSTSYMKCFLTVFIRNASLVKTLSLQGNDTHVYGL